MEEIAARAVKQAFRDMGIEDGDPHAMRQDFMFLREWRETCREVRSKGTLTVVGIVATGLIGLLVLGFKGYFTG